MKAVQIHQFGGPEELRYEDAPMPAFGNEDVLVRVHATGVNPIDWKVRQGYNKDKMKTQFPLILGWDFSGTVEEVGRNVTRFKKGDAVYGRPDIGRSGTYAEYVAVRADALAPKPQSLDHTQAAAVALAGLTAWQGLMEHGQLQQGQRILINGAAGGVGSYAVQFARWKGADTIGTASPDNKEYLKDLGADTVIDYHKPGFEEDLPQLDVIFDTIGGEAQKKLVDRLRKGGILVSTVGLADQKLLDEKGVQGKAFMAESKPEDLEQIAKLIDEGRVKVTISKVLPLSDAAKAHRLSEQKHTRGKIVLEVK